MVEENVLSVVLEVLERVGKISKCKDDKLKWLLLWKFEVDGSLLQENCMKVKSPLAAFKGTHLPLKILGMEPNA